MPSPEDQRSAANIYASLSSYVITAALGVIAAQAALAVFVLDKREHLFWFYFWMIAGGAASVISVVLGGRGVAAIASSGFKGEWTLKPKGDYFNRQAGLCLLGVLCLLFSLFSGATKSETSGVENRIDQLSKSVQLLQDELNETRGQIVSLRDQTKTPGTSCCSCCPDNHAPKTKSTSRQPDRDPPVLEK